MPVSAASTPAPAPVPSDVPSESAADTTATASGCAEEVVTCVPCWVRGGEETCVLHILPSDTAFPTPYPLTRKLRVLAIGTSVGTAHLPNGVLCGNVVIVRSWEHLHALANGESSDTGVGKSSGGATGRCALTDGATTAATTAAPSSGVHCRQHCVV